MRATEEKNGHKKGQQIERYKGVFSDQSLVLEGLDTSIRNRDYESVLSGGKASHGFPRRKDNLKC